MSLSHIQELLKTEIDEATKKARTSRDSDDWLHVSRIAEAYALLTHSPIVQAKLGEQALIAAECAGNAVYTQHIGVRFGKSKGSVLQPWVHSLPFMQQAVLMTCVRGCDTAHKFHPSKLVTRAIRAAVFHQARPKRAMERGLNCNFFTIGQMPPTNFEQGWDDELPSHWKNHILHGVEILAYKHPDDTKRAAWLDFYDKMCDDLHMPAESMIAMDKRLSDEDPYPMERLEEFFL